MTARGWYVYRHVGWSLQKLVERGFALYAEHHGDPPQAVCVPASQVELAHTLLPEDVEIEGCGGTLVGELWMQSPEQAAELEPSPATSGWSQTAMF